MKEKKPSGGKISLHGNGMGVPSPEDIERRAREIAMIDERNPEEFTDADWNQARQELMGRENNNPPEETPDNAEITEEWNVVASSKRAEKSSSRKVKLLEPERGRDTGGDCDRAIAFTCGFVTGGKSSGSVSRSSRFHQRIVHSPCSGRLRRSVDARSQSDEMAPRTHHMVF